MNNNRRRRFNLDDRSNRLNHGRKNIHFTQNIKRFASDYKITIASKVPLDRYKPMRGGMILYKYINGERYFILGISRKEKEITDFGGGISYKYGNDINVLRGTLRELDEETLGILDISKHISKKLHPDIVNSNIYRLIGNDIVLYTEDVGGMLLIFHNVDEYGFDITENIYKKNFEYMKTERDDYEVENFITLTEKEFISLVNTKSIYVGNKEIKGYPRIMNYIKPVIYELLDKL